MQACVHAGASSFQCKRCCLSAAREPELAGDFVRTASPCSAQLQLQCTKGWLNASGPECWVVLTKLLQGLRPPGLKILPRIRLQLALELLLQAGLLVRLLRKGVHVGLELQSHSSQCTAALLVIGALYARALGVIMVQQCAELRAHDYQLPEHLVQRGSATLMQDCDCMQRQSRCASLPSIKG